MNRCHLKGAEGDAIHAALCAAGFNIRWLLRMIRKKHPPLFGPDKSAEFSHFVGKTPVKNHVNGLKRDQLIASVV
jgi:hypothetical protein